MISSRRRSGFGLQKIAYIWIVLFSSAFDGPGVSHRPARAESVLIRWGSDAPERLRAVNVVLYEKLVADRDANPTVFDKHHPFFFGILTDPAYMDQIVARWEAHEERFEYWHPYLWRILDGYEFRPDPSLSRAIIPPPDPGNPGTGQPGGSRSGGGGGAGGGVQPDAGGGNTCATPEPSSFVLWISGLTLALLGPVFKKYGPHRRAGPRNTVG